MNVVEAANYMYILIFLVAAVVLVGVLICFSPSLMAFLDRISDERSQARISRLLEENKSGRKKESRGL